MFPSAVYFGFFLISQVCFGVLSNSSVFMALMHTLLSQLHLMRPIDFIMVHLTVVNNLTIIVTLIPYIMISFGIRHFLDDTGCKVILYAYRVTRGVSICTTSLMSTFQAITISSVNSKWARLKPKLSAMIMPSLLIFWINNLLIYINVIPHVRAIGNFSLVGPGYFHAYCQTGQMKTMDSWLYIIVILAQDLVFLTLMLCTSLYMVSLLYRHHRIAKYVHRCSSQTPAEIRATQNIVLVVCCFAFFYCSNNFFTFYSLSIHEKIPALEAISAVLSSCFPIISPFFLMRNNKLFSKYFCFTVMRFICPHTLFSG
ncbi:vomeronasal 1 receptor cavPorV1R642 [Cavia porcellus]|uniref:vomeronasal 1 receptor cavPorV1R642 n=1 Tax=Cavia porcellus TaxID=10141 RepID=UPI0001CF741F|nr:vomeronasal 1 receptor cavPorV1R642 [Cavia porcellus]